MRQLRPFMRFYGAKWRAAPLYPPPKFDIIIEPFAGSAGYSLRYPDRKVVLVEKNPKIAAVWRYLIAASPDEIRGLPDLGPTQDVRDLSLPDAESWLIGFWLQLAARNPKRHYTKTTADPKYASWFWGPQIRDRLAQQVEAIKHWTIIEGEYHSAPDLAATWFIDPPYNNKPGRNYDSQPESFEALGDWCRARVGQVMVCENVGADWLPFRPFAEIQSSPVGGVGKSKEAIWTNDITEASKGAAA